MGAAAAMLRAATAHAQRRRPWWRLARWANPNPNPNPNTSTNTNTNPDPNPSPNPNPNPDQVRRAPPVCIALRVAAAFAAGDAVGFW